MSIGLYDADINKFLTIPFNLEIMKMASYFSSKKEIIKLTTKLMPERYQKFYYRQDYYDGNFPSELFLNPNVIIGGLAFTNNIYNPMPIDIENSYPDTGIYNEYVKFLLSYHRKYKNVFNTVINSSHTRLSLDGKNIWDNFSKHLAPNNKWTFLHDYNLNDIKDADLVAKDLTKKKKSYIYSKFPIIVNNDIDYLKWNNISSSQYFYKIQIDNLLTLSQLENIAESHTEFANTIKTDYYINKGYKDEKEFYNSHGWYRIVKHAWFLGSRRLKFNLVVEPFFFSDPEAECFLQFLNCYKNWVISMNYDSVRRRSKNLTPSRFAFYLKEKPSYGISKQFARDAFKYVRANDEETFYNLYEGLPYNIKEL